MSDHTLSPFFCVFLGRCWCAFFSAHPPQAPKMCEITNQGFLLKDSQLEISFSTRVLRLSPSQSIGEQNISGGEALRGVTIDTYGSGCCHASTGSCASAKGWTVRLYSKTNQGNLTKCWCCNRANLLLAKDVQWASVSHSPRLITAKGEFHDLWPEPKGSGMHGRFKLVQ